MLGNNLFIFLSQLERLERRERRLWLPLAAQVAELELIYLLLDLWIDVLELRFLLTLRTFVGLRDCHGLMIINAELAKHGLAGAAFLGLDGDAEANDALEGVQLFVAGHQLARVNLDLGLVHLFPHQLCNQGFFRD